MSFDRRALQAYLNDHLAGSVAALRQMDRICDAHGATRLGMLMSRFRAELQEEQAIVRTLIGALGGTERRAGRAVAWLGEQVSRIKLGPGKNDPSGLRLFEALEVLSTGFWGRGALWRTLTHLNDDAPLPSGADFAALAYRAESHLEELEELRLMASQHALMQVVPA